MSTKGFSFPPPPPPPPPSHSSTAALSSLPRQSPDWRGRGRGRGSASGRGQGGNWPSRGGFCPDKFQPSRQVNAVHGSQDHHGQRPNIQRGRGEYGNGANRGQKRRHDQAFATKQQGFNRHAAPPQVPSFGFDMNAIPPSHATSSKAVTDKKKQPEKRNMFGLAPSMDDVDEAGDNDEEEEARLAKPHQSGGASLQVTYGGRTMSLNSPEELAAWIAERKKRFATKARVEEAAARSKAEAEERARQKAAMIDERKKNARDKHRKGKDKEKQMKMKQSTRMAYAVVPKSSRLDRELEEARRRVQELERAQRESEYLQTPLSETEDHHLLNNGSVSHSTPLAERTTEEKQCAKTDPASDDLDELMNSSSDNDSDSPSMADSKIGDEEETSSSGMSSEEGSENDEGPKEISSKNAQPKRETLAPRERPVCRDFSRAGRCPRGARCHFKHEPPSKRDRVGRAEATRHGSVRGKSLFQRLREQELDMTNELVLQHILYLGDNGYLQEP